MTENKPRYSRISDILDLAMFMASRIIGVTINEIADRYNVSRRTAERMRDSITCIFPQVDVIETEDKQKHWGFTNYSISHLVSFSSKEIANIEQLQRRTTNLELKDELNKTVEKIKVLNNKNQLSIDKKIELYMQTEGYAVRQTPQYKMAPKIMELVRDSIHNTKILKGVYHDKTRKIEPLGLIYGTKIYLIAREKAKGNEIYTYLLHKFENLTSTNEVFQRNNFNLQEYTNKSFGIYQGEILNVKLSFTQDLASEAIKYNFHPTQKVKLEKDGTLTVEFKASGNQEIIWHIFKWGAGCRIVSPKSLKDEYKKYLLENLNNY